MSLHSINFSWQIEYYLEQLAEISQVIQYHQGPLIIDGDFNTWIRRRLIALSQWMYQHGLQPVRFKNDSRSLFLATFWIISIIVGLGCSMAGYSSQKLPITMLCYPLSRFYIDPGHIAM